MNFFGEESFEIPTPKKVKKTFRHLLVDICALKYKSSDSVYFKIISTTRQEFFNANTF